MVERLENTLTLGHLATLPKRNKDHFVSAFTQQQQHFSQQYLYEGQRVARSWDDSEPMSPPNPPKDDPQLGFGTPVLRARLDLVSTRMSCHNGLTSRNKITGGQESSKENERPSGHSANLLETAKYDFKLQKAAECKKKNVSRVDKKRSKEHNLPSDSDKELVERRADRRQRKKTKRDIMNPETSEDSDNEDILKIRKQAKRQSKLRQEFALMHGFASTNIGKNRLTLNPGRRDIGVFQKGKASEKTDVIQARKHKRQESGFHFSEATLLSKPGKKSGKIDFEKVTRILGAREEDSAVSSASASISPPTRARTESDMVEARSRKVKGGKVPSKSNLVSKTKPQSQDEAQTSYNPADSIVWDIERAELLGSEVSSGVKQTTIVSELAHLPLTSNEVVADEALDTNILTNLEAYVNSSHQKSLSMAQSDTLSNPSLGPSQSASQIGLRTVNVALLPTGPSKYFKPLPPRLAEPDLALTRYTINQFDAKPSAFSELGELSTIEGTIPQIPEPASRLHHSPGLSARSYGQEDRPNLIPPMQPSYDLEAAVYYEGYLDSEFWSPVDHSGGLSVERSDNTNDIVDHVSVDFDGQNNSNFIIPANDEVWPLDYIACRELGEVDQIYDTSFTPFSGHQSTELHNSISPSMWLDDAYSDVSERCRGLVYQDSGRDRLSVDLGSEDQQTQSDGDFNLEHEGVSALGLELYPDVVHHFWQGRSLLYGFSTPGDSSSLHKLSNVEADVARKLQLDHWQPQKL